MRAVFVFTVLVALLATCSALHNKLDDSQCRALKGQCVDTRAAKCVNGNFISNKCKNSGNEIKCCVGTVQATTSAAPRPALPTSSSSGARKLIFSDLVACYPQGDSETVKKNIGGKINASWITNTCAVRMSNTLHCAAERTKDKTYALGAQPNNESVSDAKGRHHVYRVLTLVPLVQKMFAKANKIVRKASNGKAGVDKTPFLGKKGIIRYDTRGAWNDASGHFDLWDGKAMVEKNHADAATVDRYFGLAVEVTLWEVPDK